MAKNADLPGMKGKGVERIEDKELDRLGGELDDLRAKRAKLSEKITLAETNCVNRMKELEIDTYYYDDRVMTLSEGKDHIKTKEVKGDEAEESSD